LAITIFLLDLCYAIADPRIQIGNQNHTLRIARRFNIKEWIISLTTPRIKHNKVVPRKLALAPVTTNHKDPAVHQVKPALPIQNWIIDGIFKIAQMWKYPPIVIGGLILAILVEISIFTMLILPYNQAVKLWQAKQTDWYRYPKNALPAWINAFRKEDLPSTIILNSTKGGVIKEFKEIKEDFYQVDLTYNFDYPYSGGFPQDVDLLITTQYKEKRPHLTLTWTTPDGREIDLGSVSVVNGQSYRLFLEESIQKKLKDRLVARALFGASDPNQPVRKAVRDDGFSETDKPLTGPYRLHVKAYLFEKDAKLDAELLIYGQVYGVAGTDNKRRDLLIGLLWGTPIALAFGIVAALGTSLSTMLFAAVSTWFGGWVDEFIQRLTEINMLIPFYPICLMIYVLYSKSFLVILGVAVALSIFGSGIKNYRAVFLQIREEPFIEAARTYGASDWRIIFKYLIPRIRTVLVPQLIYLVPSYVFLEASLAVLGLSDPKIPPTWGQLVVSGLGTGLYYEGYYLSLIPAVLLILTGVAFLLIGKSLEQIFEPRLREM
jgi:peptide/nickel transport system permease protein